MEFSNLTTLRGDMGQKLHFSRYHKAVGTQNIPLNMNPIVFEFFKSDYLLLGEEMWHTNCIFQDNIALWVLKTFI